MNNAGLEALAGRGGTLPAKASSPVFIISRSLAGAWKGEKIKIGLEVLATS